MFCARSRKEPSTARKRDCGTPCTTTGTNFYWACSSSSSCTEIGVPLAQQVQNPVWLFPTDNNGVLIQLPAIGPAAPSVSGSLIFGIGTQSNNGLGNAVILTVDSHGHVTTVFNGTPHSGSFIDSGSNGIFFAGDLRKSGTFEQQETAKQ